MKSTTPMATTSPAFHWRAERQLDINELPQMLQEAAQTGTDVFVHTPEAAFSVLKLSGLELTQIKVFQGRIDTLDVQWSTSHPLGMSSHQAGELEQAIAQIEQTPSTKTV
jgi:hypothetical protein